MFPLQVRGRNVQIFSNEQSMPSYAERKDALDQLLNDDDLIAQLSEYAERVYHLDHNFELDADFFLDVLLRLSRTADPECPLDLFEAAKHAAELVFDVDNDFEELQVLSKTPQSSVVLASSPLAERGSVFVIKSIDKAWAARMQGVRWHLWSFSIAHLRCIRYSKPHLRSNEMSCC
jgi:hypothetical protein